MGNAVFIVLMGPHRVQLHKGEKKIDPADLE